MSLQTRLSGLITAIGADIKELKGSEWTEPSEFGADWGNYHPSYARAAYRKEGKVVYLAGMVANPTHGANPITTAQLLFTLPVGFRPATYVYLTSMSNSLLALVMIYPDGRIYLGQPGYGNWYTLDGLCFRQYQ